MFLKLKIFSTQESVEGLDYVPFRESIRLFLQDFSDVKEETVGGMKIWSTLVTNETNGVVFPLYVVEESVQSSVHPFCDHCKFAEWGNHYVSKRRYHLIILEKDRWDKPFMCDFSELRTHILYGLVHCNGYGHLICINGFKVDSIFFSKSVLMGFWDRICTTLNTRKISVCDSLMEGSMELRLLHGVAFGQSWFGEWGFKFSCGSYGVTEQKYETAIEFLSSLELDRIINDFENKVAGRQIKKIIDKYREGSETPLITISDLLKFMLGLKFRGSTKNKRTEAVIKNSTEHDLKALEHPVPMKLGTLASSIENNKWRARRVEYVLMVIVNFLKEKKANRNGECVVSWQELYDETRKRARDFGLVHYVLKSISSLVMGNHVIHRSANAAGKYEFKIHEVVKETKSTGLPMPASSSDCRWHGQGVQHAAEVVISLLKANCGKRTMSLQELQNKARESIRDSGLIDFVLKSVNNTMIGSQITYCSKHLSFKKAKFAIKDVLNQPTIENLEELPRWVIAYEKDVREDLLFLYSNVLFGYRVSDSVSLASRTVIDSKQFVKEWPLEDQEMKQLKALRCQVFPDFEVLETELTRPLSSGELVVVPTSITINQLKGLAESAFRDTYCIMDKFVVTQIGGLRAMEEDELSSRIMEPNPHVWIRGSGFDLDTKLRYEGGPSKLAVKCICGARKDDGERMMPCNVCQVWQHTSCRGIDDDDEAPPSVFRCASCSRG